MSKNLLQKNGWHIRIDKGGVPYWEEDVPQYKLPCTNCNTTGKVRNSSCDCLGICMCEPENCFYCGGLGFQRSAPLTPMPDREIVSRLYDALAQTVRDFKVILDNGELEAQILKERCEENSLKSSSL